MTNLNQELSLLGLTEKEQRIFSALLKLGLVNATTLSKEVSIKRPSVYGYLEKLRDKGFVIEVRDHQKKYFKLVSGTSLRQLIHAKSSNLTRLEKSLPKLIKDTRIKSQRDNQNYLVYDGIKACQNLMEEIARSGNDIYFMGSLMELHKFYDPTFLDKIYLRPLRKRLRTEFLITDWDKNTIRVYYEESGIFTKKRFLPKDFSPKGCLASFGNKLVVVHYLPKPYAIVMEDSTMVELFKMAFFSLWKDLEGKNIPPQP